MVGSIVLLFAIAGLVILVYHFASPFILDGGAWLKTHFGWPGIAAIAFLVDLLPLFVSSDPVFAFTDGWNVPILLSVMSVASMAGGLCAFLLARLLGKTRPLQNLVSGYLAKGRALFVRHGTWAIAIAALTPVPYGPTCWVAGIMEIPFRQVFIGSLFRIPRMILYYLAIKGGIGIALLFS